jgi:flagellar protein FliO/FliZ
MDFSDYLRFATALIFVLGLIGAGAFALRYFGFGGHAPSFGRNQTRRLAIVETLYLDPKRRLALIRRDGVEHLIVLGAQGETVIERNIAPPSAVTRQEHQTPEEPRLSLVAER